MGIGCGIGACVPFGGGAPQWLPTALPGCVLWLRADMGITLNGSDVSAWADQSGRGNDAAQGTAAYQPAYAASGGPNGTPCLQFSGTNEHLRIPDPASGDLDPGVGSFFAWCVYKPTASSTWKMPLCKCNGTSADNIRCAITSADVLMLFWGSNGQFYAPTTVGTISADTWHFMAWGIDAAESDIILCLGSELVRTGVTVSGTGANAEDYFIGCDSGILYDIPGDIAELGFCKGLLGNDQIGALRSYLQARYGL